MERKKKILFVYTTFSTFVKTDFEILSTKYVVTKYQFKPLKGFSNTAIQFIKQFCFLLINIWRFDAVFIWFADQHTFLPVLFAKITGKKSFVVIGGYDVVRMPELNYGVFTSKVRGFCAVFSMKQSTLNIAVSKYVERKVRWITKKQNIQLVYNCVNIPSKNNLQKEKENLIISVGLIDSTRTFLLKGIDTFIEVARMIPYYSFKVIGIDKKMPPEILNNRPDNVEFIERVDHNELENYYKRAKIYCQFSRSESFGVAVVEAMNFGCLPIVTNIGGLPEIVGNYGIVIKRDVSEIPGLIIDLIKKPPHLLSSGKEPLKPFMFSTRKEWLTEILNKSI